MSYPKHIRARCLQVVAKVGYEAAARLTGVAESTLRRWAADATVKGMARRTGPGSGRGGPT